MSVFLSSRPLSAPSTSSSSTSRPPTTLLHAGTVGVRGGHVPWCCRGVVVMVVVMCWGSRHGFGPAPEHGCRVVHVHIHVLVATPRCRRHGTKPGCRGGKYGGSSRQTGRQFSRLGEVCDVHVDVGLVEAGDGGPVTVHLCGVVQHWSQTRHLQQRPFSSSTIINSSCDEEKHVGCDATAALCHG